MPRRPVAGTVPAAVLVTPSAPGVRSPGPPSWRAALDVLWAALEDGASRHDALDRSGGSATARPGGGIDLRPGNPSGEEQRIEALVELAQGGDREAFAQLYDAYVDIVFRYLLVRVADRALAEDLTSETFLRALRRIDTFTWQGRDIAAWFVTIARNLVADHVKSARFRFEVTTADMRDADEHVDAPEAEVLARLRDERLVAAIRSLRPEQAECITLRFLQGLSLAETARVLDRSEGAVKQLQLRATRALRAALDGIEL